MGVSMAFLKSKQLVRNIYSTPPLFAETNPDAMWKLSKPMYGFATTRRERYGSLKIPLTRLGGKATLLDKSLFFWASGDSHYGFGRGLRVKCIGVNEKGIFEANKDFAPGEKRDVVGISISHVGDLLIYGSNSFISYLSRKLENRYGVKAFGGNEAIYLGMTIGNPPNEFIEDGNIFTAPELSRV